MHFLEQKKKKNYKMKRIIPRGGGRAWEIEKHNKRNKKSNIIVMYFVEEEEEENHQIISIVFDEGDKEIEGNAWR